MNLSHKRIKGRGFPCPIDLPRRIDPKELDLLVARLRSGDESVKTPIIYGHLALAAQIVTRYNARTVNKAEELFSVAMLAIVWAVGRAKDRLRDNNITPYIVAAIHSKISDYLDRDHLVKVPRFRDSREARPIFKELDDEVVAPSRDGRRDTLEMILKSAQDEREVRIIELRLEGYTSEEIANMLGISYQLVNQLRAKIHANYIRSCTN